MAGGGWGMTLFLRRGVAAWMRAWPAESDRPPARPRERLAPVSDSEEPELSPGQDLPSQLYRSVAKLLAEMLLQTRQEVFS
jgi:hypothetical protein